MGLFSSFRKKGIKNSEQPPAETPNIKANENEQYYFENLYEFALYTKFYAKDKNNTVVWLKGDNYKNEFKRAYQLYEQGDYNGVIKVCKDSFALNPIAISARFEICEAYLKLHNLLEAKHTLMEMQQFMVTKPHIARFYRRLGFVEIELGNYKSAAACYQYSQQFEDHPSIIQELMYIVSKGGKGALTKNPESFLKEANLPVLTAIEPE